MITGVRPMIETVPPERANEAYQRMMSGKAEFRVALTMGGEDFTRGSDMGFLAQGSPRTPERRMEMGGKARKRAFVARYVLCVRGVAQSPHLRRSGATRN
jgi:hypothetical protein